MESRSSGKVLFLITKSNWGGAQAYVYALATALHAEGVQVMVASGGTGEAGAGAGLLAERLKESDIPYTFLTSFSRNVSIGRELRAFRELLTLLRTERPLVLHLNSSKAGGLGALAGRFAGVKRIVYTAHGWPHQEPRPAYARFLIWIASWVTILLSHRVIAVSEKDYKKAPVFFSRKKVRLVPNGIASFPLLSKEEARKELSAREPRLEAFSNWLLMTAELHANKGIDTAIHAFKEISNVDSSAVLVVLGEGEERERLGSLIHLLELEDRVFLLGFVPDSRHYLKAGTLMLLPSRKEGLPMVLLEAGLAGLPVIASEVGGMPEVILNGKTGVLIPANKPALLAEAIRALLADHAEQETLGNNLRTRVETEYSAKRMITETEKVYRD